MDSLLIDQRANAGRYRANTSRRRQPAVCEPTRVGLRTGLCQESGAVKTQLAILGSRVIRGWLVAKEVVEERGCVLLCSLPLSWLRVIGTWSPIFSSFCSIAVGSFSITFSFSFSMASTSSNKGVNQSRHQTRPSISNRKQDSETVNQSSSVPKARRATSLERGKVLEDSAFLSIENQPSGGSTPARVATPGHDSGTLTPLVTAGLARIDASSLRKPSFTEYRSPRESTTKPDLTEVPTQLVAMSPAPQQVPRDYTALSTQSIPISLPPSTALPSSWLRVQAPAEGREATT